jgi:hypothetical protein
MRPSVGLLAISLAATLVHAPLLAQSAVGTSLTVPQFASTDPADPGGLAPGEVTANPGDEVIVPPAAGAQLKVTFNVETVISLPASTPLVGPGGAEFPVGLLCAQAATADHPTPAGFTCASGYTADPQNGNERWVYVGIHIAAGATENIPAGVYSADVTVTLAF